MYPNSFMNKPFMANTPSSNYGASTSTFGQPTTNTPMFPTMQPTNIFHSSSTPSFTGPTTQSTFGTNLFGQQPSTSGLFGGNNSFGQNKSNFGFGATPSQSGLFGQQAQQPSTSSLFQSTSTNLFGNSSFGNQQTTGTVIKFSPVTGSDTMQKNGITTSINTKHHCITCMKEYESKSFEELRFEDYSCSRKGPQQQPGFSTPFGPSTSGAANSLFGQPDNKQGFGQTPGFGQNSSFGPTGPGFGLATQTSTPSLFGKPTFGAVTSSTPAFGFNNTPPTANPFSASQPQKPFSQPLFGAATTQAQSTFGTGVFGQNANQNTATNLFQKPVQAATGFNTNQSGFSFNQTATTQAPNLFQVSKPNTGFGIFGQTNTAPTFGQPNQTGFGTNFGKLTTTFSQPPQPGFGTSLGGGLTQQPLFGNANKPPSLFGNTGNTGIFSNNMFQPAPSSFLSMNPQQMPFPTDPADDAKNLSLVVTDIFPDGPHVYGLEPIMPEPKTATNPVDLKAIITSSKKREELMGGTKPKIKVLPPRPKRGADYKQEFFETNQLLKNSPRCLVIRKFNETNTTIFSKYENELLQEAEKRLIEEAQSESTIPSPRSLMSISQSDSLADVEEVTEKPDNKVRNFPLRLKFESYAEDTVVDHDRTERNRLEESAVINVTSGSSKPTSDLTEVIEGESSDTSDLQTEPSCVTLVESEGTDGPGGVILTKPEYYIYPALTDLDQYMNGNECIVQGLTIGRRGYGNIYFPDAIDISNMNFDEIVYFRHREVIVYPDEATKPPMGEGLNRRAQVTLDKIYPREKGTNNYITDVKEILNSSFVENLMHVTHKHNCKFVEYRPKTGSWVFKVKHFSKYGFTESDDDMCEIKRKTKKSDKPKADVSYPSLKDLDDISSLGLSCDDGSPMDDLDESESAMIFREPDLLSLSWRIRHGPEFDDERELSLQAIKSSIFNKDLINPYIKETVTAERVALLERPSEVISIPKIYRLKKLPAITEVPSRCYSDFGIFKNKNYRVGWGKGFTFYGLDSWNEGDVGSTLNQCMVDIRTKQRHSYNSMMPNLELILETILDESVFTLDKNHIPTVRIDNGVSYLNRLTGVFNDHVMEESLRGHARYLASVWNLCTALWGESDPSPCGRRHSLSKWIHGHRAQFGDHPEDYVMWVIQLRELKELGTRCKETLYFQHHYDSKAVRL